MVVEIFHDLCSFITYLVVLQRHEVVVNVLVASVFFHSCFELFVVQHFAAVFKYKGVSGIEIKSKKDVYEHELPQNFGFPQSR